MIPEPVDTKQSEKGAGSILAVDDNPNNLRLLSGLLAQKGYEVRPAINGALALKSAISKPPELILLDIRMPEMDGYEVCRQLKADVRTAEIPVLFISALEETIDKVKAFEVGGVDYISKPFQSEEVLPGSEPTSACAGCSRGSRIRTRSWSSTRNTSRNWWRSGPRN